MKTILIVAGTRPEIIKTAPIVLEAQKRKNEFKTFYCLTGQHKTMAMEALSIFGIQPDDDLSIMRPNQTLNDICEAIFSKLPPVIAKVKPDVLMVQGDTTTAAMAALVAFNLKIDVAHIEAGLRTYDMTAPYPEECNRRLIGVVSKYNFCPTEASRKNLLKENADVKTLFVTGNTVVDALRYLREHQSLDNVHSIAPQLRTPYVLVTAHRRESFGGGFENICRALKDAATTYPQYDFIYPVHLNPNVQAPVNAMLGNVSNVHLVAPMPYLQLLTLLKNCAFVLTDSGGIQEEAPTFGKHCIVLRDVTERMESVDLGMSELVGAHYEKIMAAVNRTMQRIPIYSEGQNPYGDGHTSKKILDILAQQ
ncbi:MAG TPA: UDP-N-acetylglucosamine 2-epimerase (non-hydrolyzing) [Bacteroidota bacterium]|nr:UDP-N-acetylglucosamine 2-epimerase (non-hydrolyzing) [Bacteroidota bacterium]